MSNQTYRNPMSTYRAYTCLRCKEKWKEGKSMEACINLAGHRLIALCRRCDKALSNLEKLHYYGQLYIKDPALGNGLRWEYIYKAVLDSKNRTYYYQTTYSDALP